MLSFLVPYGIIKFFKDFSQFFCLILPWIVCVFLLGQCGAWGQESIDTIKNKISTTKEKIREISCKELELMDELDSMERGLFQSRKKTRNLKKEITSLQGKIMGHTRKRDILIRQMLSNRDYTAKRLNAMYIANGLNQGSNPDSLFDFLLTRNALKRILNSDMSVMEKQSRQITELEQTKKQLVNLVALESEKHRHIEANIQKIESDSLKRQKVLDRILREKTFAIDTLKILERSARTLDQQIENIDAPAEKENSEKGFLAHKGKLKFPVSGKILSVYGPSAIEIGKGFYFQSGIDISAKRGSPVRSVFKGKIIYSDWLQGYGNMVIVNHGDHYYSLYAHVEEIFKEIGEQVEAGEIIANTGDTGSIKGPCLHFEIRHHGKPVDPVKWLYKGA